MKRKDYNDVMKNIKCSDEFKTRMRIVLSDPDAAPESSGGKAETKRSGGFFDKYAALAAGLVLAAGSATILLAKPSQSSSPATPSKSDDAAIVVVEASTEPASGKSESKKPADAEEAFSSIAFMRECREVGGISGNARMSYLALSALNPATIASSEASVGELCRKILSMEWEPFEDKMFTHEDFFRITLGGQDIQINERGEIRANGAVFKAARDEDAAALTEILLRTFEYSLDASSMSERVRYNLARANKKAAGIEGKFEYKYGYISYYTSEYEGEKFEIGDDDVDYGVNFESDNGTVIYYGSENDGQPVFYSVPGSQIVYRTFDGDYSFKYDGGETCASYTAALPPVADEPGFSYHEEFRSSISEGVYERKGVDENGNEYSFKKSYEVDDPVAHSPIEYYSLCSAINVALEEAKDPRCVFSIEGSFEDSDDNIISYSWYPNIIPSNGFTDDFDLSEAIQKTTTYYKLSVDKETGLPVYFESSYGGEPSALSFRFTEYDIIPLAENE